VPGQINLREKKALTVITLLVVARLQSYEISFFKKAIEMNDHGSNTLDCRTDPEVFTFYRLGVFNCTLFAWEGLKMILKNAVKVYIAIRLYHDKGSDLIVGMLL